MLAICNNQRRSLRLSKSMFTCEKKMMYIVNLDPRLANHRRTGVDLTTAAVLVSHAARCARPCGPPPPPYVAARGALATPLGRVLSSGPRARMRRKSTDNSLSARSPARPIARRRRNWQSTARSYDDEATAERSVYSYRVTVLGH